MTHLARLFRQPFVLQLGWALVHFVWEGAVLAILAAVVLWAMRKRSAEARYALAYVALIVMAGCPVATWLFIGRSNAPAPVEIEVPKTVELRGLSIWQQPPEELLRIHEEARASAQRQPPLRLALLSAMTAAAPALPWVVWLWAAGVVALSVRLWGGWRRVSLTCRQAEPIRDDAWTRRITSLAAAMGIRRPVRLLSCLNSAGPAVVGVLRPAVLVPASVLSGLPASELDAILAHELAHIRRHDYMANLVQSVIETVLFYHPAVWWVSNRVRLEREHCCDDAAARACGDPATYATAL